MEKGGLSGLKWMMDSRQTLKTVYVQIIAMRQRLKGKE